MLLTLTELCGYLKNWFDHERIFCEFTIREGILYANSDMGAVKLNAIMNDQYYRIVGSVFNDGVHRKAAESDVLKDEVFKGAIWAMALPEAVIALAAEIKEWRAKYESADSAAMSPFNSESFGGYSYSKSAGGGTGDSSGAGSPGSWQSVFGARLNQWKKVRV